MEIARMPRVSSSQQQEAYPIKVPLSRTSSVQQSGSDDGGEIALEMGTVHLADIAAIEEARPSRVSILGLLGACTAAPPVLENNWGHLPPNVLQKIMQHVTSSDIRSVRSVCVAWREAGSLELRSVTPKSLDPAMLKRFPQISRMGLEELICEAEQASALGSLTLLQSLVLHRCIFQHSIASLSTLKGLDTLKLQDVRAASQADLDNLLGSLPGLTLLEVTRMSGHKHLPSMSNLASLTNLQVLTLADTHHRERLTTLTQLSNLTGLQHLSLSKVRVDGNVVGAMSGLSQLASLEIPDSYRVVDSALPSLSPLTGLTRLNFRSTSHRRDEEITDVGIAALATLTNLEALDLSGHRGVTSQGLAFLSTFTKLKDLDLLGVPLWPNGVPFLSELVSLNSLNLSHTNLSAEQLQELAHLQNLHTLIVSDVYLNNDAATAVAMLAKLEVLDVSHCPLYNKGLATIVSGCPMLHYINIDGCWISTLGVLAVLRLRPNLQLWSRGSTTLPRWMYKVDTVLMARTQLHTRRLRVFHQGESSIMLTISVFLSVVSFFLFYFAFLFLFFTTVFLFPMMVVAIIFAIVCFFTVGARWTHRSMQLATRTINAMGSICCMGPIEDPVLPGRVELV